MRLIPLALLPLVLLSACQSAAPPARDERACAMFAATSMRIHPIFTDIKDWTGDGKPDGVEALLEFQDRFSDPVKAMGSVVFELFEYRRDNPDPRGNRVANPWVASINTVDQQREHWNRTSRTYSFQLAFPAIHPTKTYVLTAIFERSGGGRFFDRTILTPAGANHSPSPASRPVSP